MKDLYWDLYWIFLIQIKKNLNQPTKKIQYKAIKVQPNFLKII